MNRVFAGPGFDAYAQALSDPKVREIEPGVIMRPFHTPIVGLGQEWHVYCERHPDFGFCGLEGEACESALKHGRKHERSSLEPKDD